MGLSLNDENRRCDAVAKKSTLKNYLKTVTYEHANCTLTTSADSGSSFSGGTGNDSFVGVVVARGATGTTAAAGDALVGGAGTDTFTISVTGDIDTTADATDTHYTIDAINTSGVERILLANFEDSTDADANIFYSAGIATGLTTVGMSSSGDEGDTTFSNLGNLVNAEMSHGTGDLTLTYLSSTLTAGTSDALTLTLTNVTKQSAGTGTAATFTSNGIETFNVVSNTAANTVTLAGDTLKTVSASGAANLTLGTLVNGVTTLNASSLSGNLTATLGNSTVITVTGGSGNDTLTTAAEVSSTASINAGAGTADRLVLAADAHLDTTTEGARYTNFESLGVAETAAAPANRAFSATNLAGLTSVAVTAYNDNADGDAATTGTVDFTALEAATKAMSISGIATTENAHDLTLTVSALMATNTTADEMTVTLGTATAGAGSNAVAGGNAGDRLLNVTLNQHETVNLVSQGAANFVTNLTSAALTTLNISGTKDLTINAIASATGLSKIDASGMTSSTGAIIINGNASTTASAITGGAGNDSLIGGTRADTISGGAGNDSISGAAGADVITGGDGIDTIVGGAGIDNLSGGAGNDIFSLGTTATDFTGATTAETVDGGEGSDSITTGNMAITILASELGAIKSIETILFGATSNAASVTLTDAVYTANGNSTLSLDFDAATTGDITVNASALTAANSISVIYTAAANLTDGSSIVGGAGNDSIRLDAVALDDTMTLTGGAGTDTLTVSATGTATLASTITGFESIKFRTATANYALTANDANNTLTSTTSHTVTVDGSNLTSGALTFNASAEDDAAYSITGGEAGDTLRGTAATTKIDTIIGGGGDDGITGDAGADSLDGGAGDDTFTVATATHFVGLTAAETVIGGAGNDLLDFTENAATTVNSTDLTAISGIERIQFAGNTTASITLTDAVFTANGSTSLTIIDGQATAALTVNAGAVTSSANSISVTTKAGTATTVNESLLGGAGNDTFTFTTANAAGVPLEATDSVNGGAGTDTLAISIDTTGLTAVTLTNVSNIEKITLANTAGTVNVGAITLADANFATVTGGVIDFSGSTTTGTAAVNASAEDDSTFVITGATGADTITGGQLVDTINGGAGADRITGHAGADVLSGGAAADTFVYTSASVAHSSGSNVDSITDFVSGTDKLEVTLDYSTLASVLSINATRASAGVAGLTLAQDALSGERGQYIYDTTAGQLYINVNADNLITSSDFKIGINAGSTASATVAADGSDINFVITGGTQGDTIAGGAGADTINGAAGTDSITGGLGADVITGGADNDTIILTEATASIDSVVVTASMGADTITGFTAGEGGDKFTSSGVTFAATTVVEIANAAALYALTGVTTQRVIAILGDNITTSVADLLTGLNGGNFDTTDVGNVMVLIDRGTTTDILVANNADTANDDDVTLTLIGTFSDITDIAAGTFHANNFAL
jgi:Ca2+-binding RTX toxin-like protein